MPPTVDEPTMPIPRGLESSRLGPEPPPPGDGDVPPEYEFPPNVLKLNGPRAAQDPSVAFVASVAGPLAPSTPLQLEPETISGLAGDVVTLIGPQTEADPAAILFQFLASFGNAIGGAAYFEVEATRHTANEFVVVVGATAKGRKGTSEGHIRRLFEMVDPDWTKERVQSGLSSGEGLIWAVRDPIRKQDPIKKQGIVVDYQELIVDPGVTDKRLLALEPEFCGVLRVLGREGNTLSAQIRQAWDSGHLRVLTKSSPATATGAHISVVGHATAEELKRYLDAVEAANGFGNRFLWVCATRSKLLPDGGQVDQGCLQRLARRVTEAVAYARGCTQVRRDARATALWHEVYEALSEGHPGLAGALCARAEAHVVRLSLIYALLDKSSVIRVEHLQSALAVWRYAEASVYRIFGDATGDRVADTILRELKAAGIKGLRRTGIRDLFSRHETAARIDAALATLQGRRLATMTSIQTDGRYIELWTVTKATKATKGKASVASVAFIAREPRLREPGEDEDELSASDSGVNGLETFGTPSNMEERNG